MKFSENFINQVSEAHNIVELINQYTELKPKGHGRYMGLCPFPDHVEKTPSFSVSETKQVYHCFGCKKSGNIYHFLKEFQGLSFVEAVEFLADKASLPLPSTKFSQQQEQAFKRKKELFKINEWAVKYFQEELKKAPEQVKAYMKKRGIKKTTIKDFHLGYAPPQWQGLCDFLTSHKVSLKSAETLGLVKKGKKGYFDMYRDRLIFPIQSPKEEFVGFGARSLNDSQQPKYINSCDSPVFSKSHTLYGLLQALPWIRKDDRVIVVEGYTDCLALHQEGFQNVVANLGTALTLSHIQALKKFTKNILLFFDGDGAGKLALERAGRLMLEEKGVFARGLLLEEGQDPDDFLKAHGRKKIKEKIQKAPEIFYFLMKKAFEGYQGQGIEKVHVIETLKPVFHKIKDQRLRTIYAKTLADRLSLDISYVEALLKEVPNTTLKKGSPPSASAQKKNEYEILFSLKTAHESEVFLLNLALTDEAYLRKIKSSGGFEQLSSNPQVQALWKHILKLYEDENISFARITSFVINHVTPPESLQKLDGPQWEDLEPQQKQKFFHDCFRKVKKAWLTLQAENLLKSSFDEDQGPILEQIMNIHRSKADLEKPN